MISCFHAKTEVDALGSFLMSHKVLHFTFSLVPGPYGPPRIFLCFPAIRCWLFLPSHLRFLYISKQKSSSVDERTSLIRRISLSYNLFNFIRRFFIVFYESYVDQSQSLCIRRFLTFYHIHPRSVLFGSLFDTKSSSTLEGG